MTISKLIVITGCLIAASAVAILRGQTPTSDAYVLGWNEGEILLDSQGRSSSITVSPALGSEDLAFWTLSMPAGSDILTHRHERTTEILFVHRGSGTLILDGVRTEVSEGATIYVPPGVYHGMENPDSEMAIAFVATPPDLLNFFRGTSWRPGDQPKVLTAEEMTELSERYDSILPPN